MSRLSLARAQPNGLDITSEHPASCFGEALSRGEPVGGCLKRLWAGPGYNTPLNFLTGLTDRTITSTMPGKYADSPVGDRIGSIAE
jgi:hypothetical protein